jgi:transposase
VGHEAAMITIVARPGPTPDRDRWHTGFVDALGNGELLGQVVEGRTVADVLAWLPTTPLTWRKNIRHLAIDMSATYRAVIRTGLPDATVLVDHFHVVQLAMVRRRTTAETRGRRGRASDPEWKARRRLLYSARTSPMSSSRRCGTRCWPRGRSATSC